MGEMRRGVSSAIIAQSFLIESAVILALWIGVPWLSAAGMVLQSYGLLSAAFTRKSGPAAAWFGGLIVWLGCITTDIWADNFAIVAGLMAGAFWLSGSRWKGLAVIWSFLAVLISLVVGYRDDRDALFFLGILGAILLLIIVRPLFNLSSLGIQVRNTLLLIFVGLPVADCFVRINMEPATWSQWYSYHGANGNPASFALWWQEYQTQAKTLLNDLFDKDPNSWVEKRIRPNSHTTFFRSDISINSKGFRGAEISSDKGDTYRIVAMGESTTFGMTLAPEDKPWPDLLEQMIRDRLKPRRPVEVINAGVPGYSLAQNLDRMQGHILPLKPDMIISYHGYNGFTDIDSTLPPPQGPTGPVFEARPLNLLAICEYRIKMILFRRQYVVLSPRHRFRPESPLQTGYAGAYRQLIAVAKANQIRLALANYSMAVNSNSAPGVTAFYASVFDKLDRDIKVNEIHSTIVRELAAQNPEVCLIDTHPHLDGENEKFIDLMHFTQAGRQQLAENIFAGIQNVLEKDLKKDQAETTAP